MDEILFYISQHWETLQIHINSGLQHGRRLSIAFTEQVTLHFNEVWHASWSDNLKIILERSLNSLRNAARQFSTVLAQPSEVYYQLSELARVEMPIFYPGSAGFLTGALIGVLIGLSWQHNVLPVQKMKAVVCMAYDGLDALSCVEDAIVPSITKPHQIIIQVKSASVDVVDIKICYGYGKTLRRLLSSYNSFTKSEFPITLGRDCAGIIVEIGPGVSKFEIGDEVWLVSPLWNTGTIAEYVLTTEDMISRKPRAATFEGASTIPYSGCLAYSACLKAGIFENTFRKRRVLIHSGVSPVGCIASQIARLNMCEVTVTCSARAAPVAKALGATEVVVYGQIEMENQLLRDRFDVVFNTVGGVSYESCLQLCKPDGVVVSTAPEQLSYEDCVFPVSLIQSLYLKSKYLIKKVAGSVNQWNDVEFSGEVLEKLQKLIDDGHVQPIVDKAFAPQDAILALQHCDSVDAIGKTVIRFRNKASLDGPTKKIPGMYITSL